MDVSKAMREGFRLVSPGWGFYLNEDKTRGCPLGSAWLAYCIEDPYIRTIENITQGRIATIEEELPDIWPELERWAVLPPNCCREEGRLEFPYHRTRVMDMVIHLWEECNWPREAIAEWVERDAEQYDGYK
jgi:hypothetical protein